MFGSVNSKGELLLYVAGATGPGNHYQICGVCNAFREFVGPVDQGSLHQSQIQEGHMDLGHEAGHSRSSRSMFEYDTATLSETGCGSGDA